MVLGLLLFRNELLKSVLLHPTAGDVQFCADTDLYINNVTLKQTVNKILFAFIILILVLIFG